MEINSTKIIASRAYFQQTPTCTRVSNLVYVASFTPMVIQCYSFFPHGRGFIIRSDALKYVRILITFTKPIST